MPDALPDDARDIPLHPGYRADPRGGIWSCRSRGAMRVLKDEWRRLKPSIRGRYPSVWMGGSLGKHRYVHQLVLEAHVGPRPKGMHALHADDDPLNNRLDNLKWGTHSENMQQWRQREGSKLTDDAVRWIRENAGTGLESLSDTARRFNVTKGMIWLILNGRARQNVKDA